MPTLWGKLKNIAVPRDNRAIPKFGTQEADGVKLRVECYAGGKADERPTRFSLDGHDYQVEEVLDRWYGPSAAFFKVRADDGNLYILRLDQSRPDGAWSLEGFLESPRPGEKR